MSAQQEFSSLAGYPTPPSTNNISGMLAGFPAGLLPADPTQDNHHLHQSGLVVDPNSPETFKQNILLVRDNVTRLQNLANSALIGMCVRS